ncbi:MAG TPA: DNA oxidative demethylase AlkB, partial [Spongiibacteraceae bacterium]|nr:DNA oxidative demethylase AlkB [Spongiibacteraceae bacterium]
MVTADLFDATTDAGAQRIEFAPGATLLRGFAAADAAALLSAVQVVVGRAPFRHMVTPGGYRMSMAITNCGAVGWVSDRSGYRYAALDPLSGEAWPTLPELFAASATAAARQAGFDNYCPDTCLINCYEPGARLSLHQDKNEKDFAAPIVSVSLGLPALFLFGGAQRKYRVQRLPLLHGDVVVWGGPARLAYHGVAALAA